MFCYGVFTTYMAWAAFSMTHKTITRCEMGHDNILKVLDGAGVSIHRNAMSGSNREKSYFWVTLKTSEDVRIVSYFGTPDKIFSLPLQFRDNLTSGVSHVKISMNI